MPGVVTPSGYAHAQGVAVTGGSATAGGSTTTPVVTTGTDYVVALHLTGTDASTVYGQLTVPPGGTLDSGATSDISMWWWNGSAWVQIDCDLDQTTNGLWSSSNVTLWFRLQAAVTAAATDSNYMLAWGQSGSITAANAWANLYPLQDDFPGSSLGAKWVNIGATNTVTISGSILTGTTTAGGNCGIGSVATYGASYVSTAYAKLGTVANNKSSFGYRTAAANSLGSPFGVLGLDLSNSTSFARYTGSTSGAVNTTIPYDPTNYHVYGLARNSSGNAYWFRDAGTPTAAATTDLSTTALPVVLYNFDSAAAGTVLADWVKVRPWMTTEPTAALIAASTFVPRGTLLGAG